MTRIEAEVEYLAGKKIVIVENFTAFAVFEK